MCRRNASAPTTIFIFFRLSSAPLRRWRLRSTG
jgi:hypothetical protein